MLRRHSPHDSKDAPNDHKEKIYDFMKNEKMVALGEMGLDYFRNVSSPRIKRNFRSKWNRQRFKHALIFHNRDADEDVLSILEEFPGAEGVAHCFSSTERQLIKFIELGYYISFSGNIIFKNSHLPEFVGKLPLDVFSLKRIVLTKSVRYRGNQMNPESTICSRENFLIFVAT